jgi:anaerobic selenocysteine-containing dehydrogenase
MTQHTTGVQGIRSFTILQLLLGNIGKPGGCTNCDTSPSLVVGTSGGTGGGDIDSE